MNGAVLIREASLVILKRIPCLKPGSVYVATPEDAVRALDLLPGALDTVVEGEIWVMAHPDNYGEAQALISWLRPTELAKDGHDGKVWARGQGHEPMDIFH